MKQEKGPEIKSIIKLHGIDNDQILFNHKVSVYEQALMLNEKYKFTIDIGIIATALIYYFNGNEKVYNLNKGLALTGNYGCGKSTLMRVFRNYSKMLANPNPNLFKVISIEDVINIMSKPNSVESSILLNVDEKGFPKPIHILVNEFGYEYGGKSYGTDKSELIETFIMKRYDIFQEYKKVMHVTMNYDSKDLQAIFNEKVYDRLKEMLNIVHMTGDSFRK